MARMARLVVAGMPHHVTQRGNRRQPVFFCDSDYEHYLEPTAGYCRRFGVEVWAYCLMPNHVHLVMVPREAQALARTVAEVHRRCTCRVNAREGWTGYLWQGRFGSSVMDGPHTLPLEIGPYLAQDGAEPEAEALRRHAKTGRPLGSAPFIASIETLLGRPLQKRKPGPKSSTSPSKTTTQVQLSNVSP